MNDYAALSQFYDCLMEVDYAARADYLLSLFARHDGRCHTLLDLACGSGSLTCELVARGCDVVAVDGSADMLALALNKTDAPLYLCQDMTTLELGDTVEGAVCTLDSFSHLLTTADLRATLQGLSRAIQPGGLLIFDANTPYKHREVLANNAFVFEREDFLCTWRNYYTPRTGEVRMLLDFFVEQPDGSYERQLDEVRERAYSERTWRALLQECGFTPLALYGDMTTEPPAADEQRWVFVARCDGNETI